VSRRKRRPGAAPEPEAGRPGQRPPEARTSAPHPSRRLALDLGILAAVFAATVGIAELAGAANLGVSIGIGQVTFGVALVVLLLRG
jgi:hypothetical protein